MNTEKKVQKKLHMMARNPYASPDIMPGMIAHTNMSAALCSDNKGNTPIDCARQYNVLGMLKMMEALCKSKSSP